MHNVIILRGKQLRPATLSFSAGYLTSSSKNLNQYLPDTQPIGKNYVYFAYNWEGIFMNT